MYTGMSHRYSPFSYDEHFCLKPPALLWAAVLYLSRAIALPLVLGLGSFAGSFAGVRSDTRGLFGPVLDAYTFLPSLVAIPVLFALIRRSPAASRTVRWIWAHGRMLLATSAVLDLVLSVVNSPLAHGEINDQARIPLLAAVFDLYFLIYILSARYVRDVFSDFPAVAGPASR